MSPTLPPAQPSMVTPAGAAPLIPVQYAMPTKKKYPVHTEHHAKASLAQVAQHGTPVEKTMVHRAVNAKYPGMVAAQQHERGLMNGLIRGAQ